MAQGTDDRNREALWLPEEAPSRPPGRAVAQWLRKWGPVLALPHPSCAVPSRLPNLSASLLTGLGTIDRAYDGLITAAEPVP